MKARTETVARGRFGGGHAFDEDPSGPVAAANLTSDPSGIVYYDEAKFIRALRTGRVGARELKVMPWRRFGKVSDEDLGAMFAYLRTVPPVKHRLDNTEPPTYCKVCGQRHGGRETNYRNVVPTTMNNERLLGHPRYFLGPLLLIIGY